MTEKRPFLAYRDVLLPRSETFIPRQYRAFQALTPLWVGARSGDGRQLIEGEQVLVGGRLERALFKQFGWIPEKLRELAARNPALIHANFGRGGALALPLARALQLPLVVTFHGGDATKHKHYRSTMPIRPVFQRRLEELKRETALFICVSDFIRRKLIERGFPTEKLAVNRYGIDRPALPDQAKERHYILFVGRLVEKKGLRFLMEAMGRVRQAFPEAELIIVGDGPLRASLEPASGIVGARFVGWQTPAEVADWMDGALAVAVPSVTAESGDAEGLPNVVLEAMARGCPVVGSTHAGIGEAVIDGETGFLCAERDVDGLARALTRLIENPDLCRRLGEAGRARIGAEFDADIQSGRLEALLQSVIR
jgi:colanic acid/amylovoran biosynthesis glycosyltransferase